MNYELHNGDCLEVMAEMPDASVDAVVTDPPYGLSFMGKRWDYDVPSVEIWREVLRVLKPGGHLLSFGGTRTYHRMVVNIEDAGFEIRDQIQWIYGSGFPKSLDVSKAMDKDNGKRANLRKFTKWFDELCTARNITNKQIDTFLGLNSNGATASHFRCYDGEQPRFPRLAFYYRLQEWLRFGDEWDAVIQEAEREVIGKHAAPAASIYSQGVKAMPSDVNITAPATEAAKQWEGWGTALKPANEPICLARKPLIGTVAENVRAHGTGAINIDGCRIGTGEDKTSGGCKGTNALHDGGITNRAGVDYSTGRFPANVIHDGSDEVVGLFPQKAGSFLKGDKTYNGEVNRAIYGQTGNHDTFAYGDSGSAARFFYCAKASKADRNEGLDGFEEKKGGSMSGPETRPGKPTNHPIRANYHPTVKPTDLMRYLCRLITPPNGTVLDPFAGSGSTGKAAMLEGFSFIGIEREPEYAEIAKARIEHARGKEALFA